MNFRWVAVPLLMVAAASNVHAQSRLIHSWATTRPPLECGIPLGDYQYGARSRSQTAVSKIAVLVKKSTLETENEIAKILKENPPIKTPEKPDLPGVPLGAALNRPPVLSALYVEPAGHRDPFPPGLDFIPHGEPLPLGIAPYQGQLPLQKSYRHWKSDREAPAKISFYQLEQSSLKIDQCEISRVGLQLHDGGDWVLSLRADQNRRADDGTLPEFMPQLHLKRNLFVVRIRGYGNFTEAPLAAAVRSGKPELLDLGPIKFWVENGQPRYLRVGETDSRIERFFESIDRVEVEFFYR